MLKNKWTKIALAVFVTWWVVNAPTQAASATRSAFDMGEWALSSLATFTSEVTS